MPAFEAVLIPEGDRLTPALVLEKRGAKLAVETIFGRTLKLAPEKCVWRRPIPAADRAEAMAWVKEEAAAGEALAGEVDAELVWEVAVDGGESSRSVVELAALYFGDAPGLAQVRAMERALRAAGDLFRPVGAGFAPRSRREVEARRAEAEARAARAAREEAALGRLAARLRAGQGAPSAEEDPEAAAWVAHVRRFVEQGSGPGREAVEALRPGRGPARERGLALLLALGVLRRPTDLLVERCRVERNFGPAHEAEVETVRARLEAEALPLADVAAYTVDDAETRDYDDALSLQAAGAGRWRIGVHVADPSPYIPIGGALDDEAYTRGTTVYLPQGKVPMFPPALSEELLALQAGGRRPALSFYFLWDGEEVRFESLRKECVQVAANLSYEEVDAWLQGESPATEPARSFRTLAAAAAHLAAQRAARGAVTLHQPELKVRAAPDGSVTLRVLDPDTPARKLVSEFMILVNATGAAWLRERDVPAIYRTQNPPREPCTPPVPYDPVRFRAEVRKLERARFTLEPGLHAGLGLSCYTQLSSPLRRYADLVMHRQLSHALAGLPVPYPDREALLEILVTSEMNSQAAAALERRAKLAWALRWLEERVNETFAAVVLEGRRGRRGALVELVDYPLQGYLEGATAPPVGTQVNGRLKGVDVLAETFLLEVET